MRRLGMVTVGVVALAAALGVAVGVMSIPDIKRYLKMRQM
jgi:hypothetical protein